MDVLLAVDESAASLRAAGALAEMAGWWKFAGVRLLNVQPEPSAYGDLLPHALKQRADAVAQAAGERALAAARGALAQIAAPVAGAVEFGDPATVIVRVAESRESGIIALGSHGASALGNLLAGSVTIKVLHLTTRPVLVIPTARLKASSSHGPPQRPARILVAVDGSDGAMAALREVVRVAPSFAARPEVHLLAVYDRTPFDVEIAAMVSAEALAEHQRRYFETALMPVRRLLADTNVVVVHEHKAVGPPARKIHEAVSEHGCDLVCIGTRGMGTVRNLVLGSTAVKVLHVAEVPVLVAPLSPAEAKRSA